MDDINKIFQEKRAEGCSPGHAQWIVGNRLMTGRGVDTDLDEAEKWFTLAWDHHFPGTAKTEAFLLKRWWLGFVSSSYSNTKRLQQILGQAELTLSERNAYITLKAYNEAQATWLRAKVDEITEAFQHYTKGRLLKVTIQIG